LCLQYINDDEIKEAITPIGLRVHFRGLNKNNFMVFKIMQIFNSQNKFKWSYYCEKIEGEYNCHL